MKNLVNFHARGDSFLRRRRLVKWAEYRNKCAIGGGSQQVQRSSGGQVENGNKYVLGRENVDFSHFPRRTSLIVFLSLLEIKLRKRHKEGAVKPARQ